MRMLVGGALGLVAATMFAGAAAAAPIPPQFFVKVKSASGPNAGKILSTDTVLPIRPGRIYNIEARAYLDGGPNDAQSLTLDIVVTYRCRLVDATGVHLSEQHSFTQHQNAVKHTAEWWESYPLQPGLFPNALCDAQTPGSTTTAVLVDMVFTATSNLGLVNTGHYAFSN